MLFCLSEIMGSRSAALLIPLNVNQADLSLSF
jgi:hypothetical protein